MSGEQINRDERQLLIKLLRHLTRYSEQYWERKRLGSRAAAKALVRRLEEEQ